MKAAASTSVATWALAAWPVRRELVDDGPAAARALGDVDLDRQVLGGDHVGLDHVGDGERVVHGRVAVAVDALVEPAVEGVQVGDDGAGAAARAQGLGALGREHRAVGDVEADHRDVEARAEHAGGGLGVGPDVELGAPA